MKVSAVINKQKFKFSNTNKSAVISALVIFIGIVSGIVLYKATQTYFEDELSVRFTQYLNEFANKNNPELFSGLLLKDVLYFVLMVIFSLCIYGSGAVFIISCLKSMGLGLLTMYIYDAFALKGVEYCLMVFFPGKFIMIFAMILLTQNCYLNSNSIVKTVKNSGDGVVDLKKFCLRTLVIFLLIIISDIVDYLTVICFSSLFQFA